MVENAMENGIRDKLFIGMVLMLVRNMAIMASVSGPIKQASDISASEGFSNFFSSLFSFLYLKFGVRTAEKNIFP